mmetsp:Transcript_38892/g.97694  ORF Transcript_38892/g.97694 Transcript_38892/m.97694 type:complete len:258 (-) Transcript_38892:612-1385(-)
MPRGIAGSVPHVPLCASSMALDGPQRPLQLPQCARALISLQLGLHSLRSSRCVTLNASIQAPKEASPAPQKRRPPSGTLASRRTARRDIAYAGPAWYWKYLPLHLPAQNPPTGQPHGSLWPRREGQRGEPGPVNEMALRVVVPPVGLVHHVAAPHGAADVVRAALLPLRHDQRNPVGPEVCVVVHLEVVARIEELGHRGEVPHHLELQVVVDLIHVDVDECAVQCLLPHNLLRHRAEDGVLPDDEPHLYIVLALVSC